MIASINANTAADQNPFVLNVSIILSTNNTIRTLIINPTKPNVIQFNGNVISFSNAHKVAFTSPNISATNNAHTNQSTCTQGTIYAAANTASADKRNWIIYDMWNRIRYKDILILQIICIYTSFIGSWHLACILLGIRYTIGSFITNPIPTCQIQKSKQVQKK